ncbi:BUD13 homolog [Anopheles aquasalis]|uniref:BUD13 homolog n=1 Tax=Anopheles aquasalis TaxID=42839 RepID=UPI00215B3084|nr:BUD13 homolog [Anopheles aquasalis]
MATKINQKEYLKRYLSNDKEKKKKKKKDKKSIGKATVRIIDDDVDFSKIETVQDGEVDLFALGEEAPQVVGIIDERPPELRAKEDFSSNKWKVVASNDGFDSTLQVRDVSGRSTGPKSSNGGQSGRAPQSDSDESPPRKSRRDSDNSPPRRRRNDSDESPPRSRHKEVRGRRANSDESPPRNKRNDRSDDESPPRRRQKERRRADSDESPPRRGGKSSDKASSKRSTTRHDSDESPPRRSLKTTAPTDRHRRHSDESPPRRGKESHRDKPKRRDQGRSAQRYDSDESPPRKRRSEKSPSNQRRDRDRGGESSAKSHRKRQDSDESPPRRRRNDSPNGVGRKDRQPTALEPPVRIKQEPQSDSDLSPPRAAVRRRDSDESPPRRGTTRRRSKSPAVRKPHRPVLVKEERSSRSPSNRRSPSPEAGPSRMTKTLDGKRAGLQEASAVREENERFRQREKEMFEKMSSDVTGRYAETVVRGRSRRDIEKELREEFEKRKHEEKKKEIYTRWGKGVKQTEDYNARLQEAAHEMEKPLARYADDTDLDDYLKKQDRLGDPMLDYLRSKRKEENKRAGIPEKPTYQGAFPDNRFNIRPGYRWDGVDRSNGFEKRWFETMSKKKAGEEEAYKYSVEDM